MKKRTFLSMTIGTALLMSGCATTSPSNDNQSTQLLSEQMTNSVVWTQESGEYRGLAYQAFHLATLAFDQAKAPAGKKKAVIVDLDETMIDNSAYAAWQVKNHQSFSPKTWTKWVEARQAKAIPGALAFAKHVVKNGGSIFYVSNRKTGAEYQPTIDNLKALGFPTVSEKTVLLKAKSSNKDKRFKQISDQGYALVLHIGDNLGDFSGEKTYHKSNAERRQFVDDNQKDFGVKYILLPNPTYGSWEGGMSSKYYKVTPAERLKIRTDNMRAWQP